MPNTPRPPPRDSMIEVRCPECGATMRVPEETAEREFKVTCPNGHVVPLAKAIG